MLITKVGLIWTNRDVTKFSKLTNSSILNNGVWLQTIFSLVLSISFILMSLRKYEIKWAIVEEFTNIDKQFEDNFYVKFFHKQSKR